MKPVFEYFGHLTTDLTECKVHFVDGELLAYVPKVWEVVSEQEMKAAATGEKAVIKTYRVTEWEAKIVEGKVTTQRSVNG